MYKKWICLLVLLMLLWGVAACKTPDAAGGEEEWLVDSLEPTEQAPSQEELPLPETDNAPTAQEPQEDGVVKVRVYQSFKDAYFEDPTATEVLYGAVCARAANAALLDSVTQKQYPVLTFSSVRELTEFTEQQDPVEIQTFQQATTLYDADFFEEKQLFVVYIKEAVSVQQLLVYDLLPSNGGSSVIVGVREPAEPGPAEAFGFILIEADRTEINKMGAVSCIRDDHQFSLVQWPTLAKRGPGVVTQQEGSLIYVAPQSGDGQTTYLYQAREGVDLQVGDTVQLVHMGIDGSGDIPKGYRLGLEKIPAEPAS